MDTEKVTVKDVNDITDAEFENIYQTIGGYWNGTDYEYEENISEVNEKIAGMDTCYFRAGTLGYLSSSIVMELFNNNKPIDEFVPKAVAELLYSIK